MKDLICQVSNVGLTTEWIKAGLNYYDWNYLLLLTTDEPKYIEIARNLKQTLEKSTNIEVTQELDPRLTRKIEILRVKDREILNFIILMKKKLREVHNSGYKIYYNATSGLELWKFSLYFIFTEENLLDKFFYFSKDVLKTEKVAPIEFYSPLRIPPGLKRLLKAFQSESLSLDQLIERYEKKDEDRPTKGLISRYLNELKEIKLVEERDEKRGRKKLFQLTYKGRWYV